VSHRLHIGFFPDEETLIDAAREGRDRGMAIDDIITPYPLHGVDELMGIRRSRLPWVTLFGGAIGLAIGLGFQYWSAWSDWPLNVGGKPLDSLPAFMPVAFEMTVLFAGLITVFALLLRCGLRPGKHARDGFDLTTDHEFALILSQPDAAFRDEEFEELLVRNGASRTQEMMTEEKR